MSAFLPRFSLSVFLILATVVALSLFCTALDHLFLYSRQAIASGEYWRLFSGHFAHLNGMHLALNLAAWLVIFLLGADYMTGAAWTVSWLACIPAVAAGIYYLSPEMLYYGGLSGVLHGLLVIIGIRRLYFREYFGLLLLLVIMAKLAYETLYGPSPGTSDLLGEMHIALESHLYGAAGGLLTGLLMIWRHNQNHPGPLLEEQP